MNSNYPNLARLCELFAELSRVTGCHFTWHALRADCREAITRLPGGQIFHRHPYCSAVKRNSPNRHHRCTGVHWEQAARQSLESRTPYTVTCYAGVTEGVVPIFRDGVYCGDVFIGAFAGTPDSPIGLSPQFRDLPRLRPEFLRDMQNLVVKLLEALPPELSGSSAAALLPSWPANCDERLNRTLYYMRRCRNRKFRLADAARIADLSVPRLQHLFKEAMGISVTEYLQRLRIIAARDLVEQTSLPLSFIAEQCGIAGRSRLTVLFRQYFSVSPAEIRKTAESRT